MTVSAMTVSAVTGRAEYEEPPGPAFLFDLDGTLIDSVYQNVIAWRNALSRLDIDLSVWRIHRRIGMSGGLFVSALLRETGRSLSDADIEALQQDHAAQYLAQVDSVRPLPGACDLLAALTAHGVPWAIATSGRKVMAQQALAMLGLPEDAPMVTRDMVRHAKPDPDLCKPGSWATVSGTCWPHGEPAHWASACCRAGTAGRNLSGPAPTASTPIPVSSCRARTRSASVTWAAGHATGSRQAAGR